MLNTSIYKGGDSYQTTNFNTPCTGLIQKSHHKSRFIRFAKGSDIEKMVFPYELNTDVHLQNVNRVGGFDMKTNIGVIILQVMIFGDNQYLCEVVTAEDFEEKLTEKQ